MIYLIIIQAKRIVKTSNQTVCGNVVAEYRDNIIIIEFLGGTKLNEYSHEAIITREEMCMCTFRYQVASCHLLVSNQGYEAEYEYIIKE
jgi:hypothetical protein